MTEVQWSELQRDPKSVTALSLVDEFPWVDVLPAADRRQFVIDFSRAFLASAKLGQWFSLEQTIREWRNTAAIHADPELAASLRERIDRG